LVLGTVSRKWNLFLKLEAYSYLSNLIKIKITICQFPYIHHLTVITVNLEAESLCVDFQIAETLELTAIMIFT